MTGAEAAARFLACLVQMVIVQSLLTWSAAVWYLVSLDALVISFRYFCYVTDTQLHSGAKLQDWAGKES